MSFIIKRWGKVAGESALRHRIGTPASVWAPEPRHARYRFLLECSNSDGSTIPAPERRSMASSSVADRPTARRRTVLHRLPMFSVQPRDLRLLKPIPAWTGAARSFGAPPWRRCVQRLKCQLSVMPSGTHFCADIRYVSKAPKPRASTHTRRDEQASMRTRSRSQRRIVEVELMMTFGTISRPVSAIYGMASRTPVWRS